MGYTQDMAGLATSSLASPERIAQGMSSAEYFALPDDHPRCELIEGELWMAPSPSFGHQSSAFSLAYSIESHIRRQSEKIGKLLVAPLDVELSDESVVQPDILLLAPDHPQVLTRRGIIQVPPILAIEVISPGSVIHDRKRKFRAYEKAGIPYYWIADTRSRSIEAWSLVDGVYELVSEATAPAKFAAPPFAELVIDLEEIFPLPQGK